MKLPVLLINDSKFTMKNDLIVDFQKKSFLNIVNHDIKKALEQF